MSHYSIPSHSENKTLDFSVCTDKKVYGINEGITVSSTINNHGDAMLIAHTEQLVFYRFEGDHGLYLDQWHDDSLIDSTLINCNNPLVHHMSNARFTNANKDFSIMESANERTTLFLPPDKYKVTAFFKYAIIENPQIIIEHQATSTFEVVLDGDNMNSAANDSSGPLDFTLSVFTEKQKYSSRDIINLFAEITYNGPNTETAVYHDDPIVGYSIYGDNGYSFGGICLLVKNKTTFQSGNTFKSSFYDSVLWPNKSDYLSLPPGRYRVNAFFKYSKDEYSNLRFTHYSAVEFQVR